MSIKNIAILYICTGYYWIYWKKFYISCEKHFIHSSKKHYFVFTNKKHIKYDYKNNVTKVLTESFSWPYSTLFRYEMFLSQRNKIELYDYVFFFNANGIFLKDISESDIFLQPHENYIAVHHPNFFEEKDWINSLEKNKESSAYLTKKNLEKMHFYAQGILQGGRSKYFLEACEKMSLNIKKDLAKGIIAQWHDETHWNTFLNERNDIKILSRDYNQFKPTEDTYILFRKKKILIQLLAGKIHLKVYLKENVIKIIVYRAFILLHKIPIIHKLMNKIKLYIATKSTKTK